MNEQLVLIFTLVTGSYSCFIRFTICCLILFFPFSFSFPIRNTYIFYLSIALSLPFMSHQQQIWTLNIHVEFEKMDWKFFQCNLCNKSNHIGSESRYNLCRLPKTVKWNQAMALSWLFKWTSLLWYERQKPPDNVHVQSTTQTYFASALNKKKKELMNKFWQLNNDFWSIREHHKLWLI